MTNEAPFDRTKWLTTTELLHRGWPRCWFEPILGRAAKRGPYKLWPRETALNVERHPIFQEARVQLEEMAKGTRYLTRDQQERALRVAIERFDAGELKSAGKLSASPSPLPEPEHSEWPKSEWTADALTLTWECGGKVIVPSPFLEAVRQGLGETGPRLALGVATVLTDWRSGHIKPNSFASGRQYFLTWLKNVLTSLQQLEQKREGDPEPVPVGSDQAPPTLH
jgi:hypothetical protein